MICESIYVELNIRYVSYSEYKIYYHVNIAFRLLSYKTVSSVFQGAMYVLYIQGKNL